MRKRSVSLLAVIAAGSLALASCSQDAEPESTYPESAVDIVVPFAPGGGTDTFARLIEEYANSEGHTVRVRNQEGAGGIVGTQSVLTSTPDGYTLAATAASSSMLNFAVGTDIPYEPEDFTYLARVTLTPLVLIVPEGSPYTTARELIDAIKEDPSSFSFGTSAAGGPSTFGLGELLIAEGVEPGDLQMVIFNGGAPTVTAVAGGQVDFAAQLAPEVTQLAQAGNIRALAVSTSDPVPGLDAPTNEEAGVPDFSHQSVSGLAGPSDLPDEVVEFWEQLVQDALADEQFVTRVEEQLGALPAYLSSEEYRVWNLEQIEVATELAEQLQISQ